MDRNSQQSVNRILDIHCPNCGAPAAYDIRSGVYACGQCGGKVTAGEAAKEKEGFRQLLQGRLKEAAPRFRLQRASCTGCGAQVVFAENEALAGCAFCGRALVRKEYLHDRDLPEIVIPFGITQEEARECLARWCAKNRGKREAKLLEQKIDALQGFYLPYEFVRGPVSCSVSRISGGGRHTCGGFIDEVFVNCSAQLDNLLLDGMEPFDLNGLTDFDFGYVAGHRVKTDNISGEELEARVRAEVGEAYAPAVRRVLETKAVKIDTDVSSVVRMPALLPVYYLSDGELAAAVNGQTGKVSVRAIRESHFYFLPWWLKAILSTAAISAAGFLGFTLFGAGKQDIPVLTGVLALFTLIVTLAAFSDTDRTDFKIKRGHRIFTSGDGALRRTREGLVMGPSPERQLTPPVFFEKLDGKMQEVVIRFSSPLRFAGMILTALAVLFLPVIVALFLNGFNFSGLELGGSAAWFCIFVPVIPIWLLKFGGIELYSRPWYYIVSPDGKKKRYRAKRESGMSAKDIILTVLRLLFTPPVCFAVWFGIACFFTMCWLTAFGF